CDDVGSAVEGPCAGGECHGVLPRWSGRSGWIVVKTAFCIHSAPRSRRVATETARKIPRNFRMLHFMPDLATLGQRMRHFRTEKGLTLEQLGADVGVAGSQLSLMENGRREPRLSLLTAIAERLGIPLSELLE